MFNDELTKQELILVRRALETIAHEQIEIKMWVTGDDLLNSIGMIITSQEPSALIRSECYRSLLIALEKIIERVSSRVSPKELDVLRASLKSFEALAE